MKALGKNVIVLKQEVETTSTLGIIYTDNTKVTYAKAIAYGEDVKTLTLGDNLVINWNAAIPIKIDEVQYHIVNIDQVYAVV